MSQLKSNFSVKSKYEAFYTGGKIQVSADGLYTFCGCGNRVNVLEVSTGKVSSVIGKEEDEEISCFTLSPDNQYLIIATQSLLLRQWKWKEKELVRSWKAIHFAPVLCMSFDSTSTLLATGSADSTIKIWDIEKKYCTHNLRGHQGVITVMAFHPDISQLQLYSAGADYKVRVWNLSNSECLAVVAAHYSAVTSIVFSQDGTTVLTSGRDGTVSVWDAKKMTVTKTLPVFERVESLVFLPEDQDLSHIGVLPGSQHFITAGSKGILRVWNSQLSRCVYTTAEVHARYAASDKQKALVQSKEKDTEDTQNIVQMLYSSSLNAVIVVTYDHNISIIGLEKLTLKKQFAGNNDEIVDVKFLDEAEKYAVVATNSMYIKVFELSTWDCEILYGHTDIVLSIDVYTSGNHFVSSGKDNTVRLWQIKPDKKVVKCLAIGQGHTHAIGTVAVSRLNTSFFVSGSEDHTLKLWQIPADHDHLNATEIHAAYTERAHDKGIASVVVAPNDKFIASGSMDKTAKLWSATDLSLLGVMRGHKKGVWCVQFSPVDKILATSSGDGAVKLWSLIDFSCVKHMEVTTYTELDSMKCKGSLIFGSGATDGLVKLWTIKNNECVKTFDEHEDKIWALAVSKTGDTFITGGADSTLVEWKDVTETELQEARAKQEDFILKEQELSNLLQRKKYLKAIGLAITLEQPFRVLNILKEILSEDDGTKKLQITLEKLRLDQIDAILRFAAVWNTNSRHCHEAQFVLSTILKSYPPLELRKFPNIKASIEGLIPYTERHFSRMGRLMQQAMFVEYVWSCMKGTAVERPVEDRFVSPGEILIDRNGELVDIDSSSEGNVDIVIAERSSQLDIAPDEMADIAPDEMADIAPDEMADISPDEMADISPDQTADIAPDEMADIAIGEKADIGKKLKRKPATGKQVKNKKRKKMKEKNEDSQVTGKLTDQYTIVKQKKFNKPSSLQTDGAQQIHDKKQKLLKASDINKSKSGRMAKRQKMKGKQHKGTVER